MTLSSKKDGRFSSLLGKIITSTGCLYRFKGLFYNRSYFEEIISDFVVTRSKVGKTT